MAVASLCRGVALACALRVGHALSSSAEHKSVHKVEMTNFADSKSEKHRKKGPYTPLTEDQREASLAVWLEDYEKSSAWVDQLSVHPAKDTDRVAVTILQPATPEKVKLMAHIIRINMHRLGPNWGLAVYYGREEEKDALSKALGNPENVVWAPIYLRGERISELGRIQFSYYLLSMDFWRMIPEAMEHVLIFGDDSIVLKGNGCIDKYADYDYSGAPWHSDLHNMPQYGGNGGFRLVKRSSSIACLSAELIGKMRGVAPGRQRVHEDEAFVHLIKSINGTFPTRELAVGFAVETVMNSSPCAIHKPWLYQNETNMRILLGSADPPPQAAAPGAAGGAVRDRI